MEDFDADRRDVYDTNQGALALDLIGQQFFFCMVFYRKNSLIATLKARR